MERTVDPSVILRTVGRRARLPAPEALVDMLAEAEATLLLGGLELRSELLATAWFLHAVASSPTASLQYSTEHRREAFQVAAHILDLACHRADAKTLTTLKRCFAAQVAFLRSELTPNSTAVFRRVRQQIPPDRDPVENVLLCACMLLGFDFRGVRDLVGQQPLAVAQALPGVAGVMRACQRIVEFHENGRGQDLEAAMAGLQDVVEQVGERLLTVSWVAIHLLDLIQGLREASIWTTLPPEVPRSVRLAFTRSSPPVFLLWKPQAEFLSRPASNPLLLTTRRIVVSTPTSAGKSLLAQLIAASHAVMGASGVCYIAPTRALCDEIGESLRARFRLLAPSGDCEKMFDVMTPEAFEGRFRESEAELLENYGLFIFDEAHLLSDGSRGWALEGVLTQLHQLTEKTHHRVALLSAALGNELQVAGWVGEGLNCEPYRTSWRGPRRLTCLLTTEPEWTKEIAYTPDGPRAKPRLSYPLKGHLFVRAGKKTRRFTTRSDVGRLVLYRDSRKRDSSSSTPGYRAAVPLVAQLTGSGPVLVVQGTKKLAESMALTIADALPRSSSDALETLASVVADELGASSPLVSCLRRGAAFYHSLLPASIGRLLLSSIGLGGVACVVATTAVTAGLNLPVRSVVVAARGGHRAQGYREYISGAKLLNAIGRAGRSARETEGVVALVLQEKFDAALFGLLTQEPPSVVSAMLSNDALEELVELEAAIEMSHQSVFSSQSEFASGFVEFMWQLWSRFGDRQVLDELWLVFRRTLAWRQANNAQRATLQRVAEAVVTSARAFPLSTVRRWASAGTKPRLVPFVEAIATRIRELDASLNMPRLSPSELLAQLLDAVDWSVVEGVKVLKGGSLAFHNVSTGTKRQRLKVDLAAILQRWIAGEDEESIARLELSQVKRTSYAREQLTLFLRDIASSLLPQAIRMATDWTELESVPPNLRLMPGYLQFGTTEPVCVELRTAGLSSRRSARLVADAFSRASTGESVVEWLRSMTLLQWHSRFQVARPSTQELLNCVQVSTGLAARVASGRSADLRLDVWVDVAVGDWTAMTLATTFEAGLRIPRLMSSQEANLEIPVCLGAEALAVLDGSVPCRVAPIDPRTFRIVPTGGEVTAEVEAAVDATVQEMAVIVADEDPISATFALTNAVGYGLDDYWIVELEVSAVADAVLYEAELLFRGEQLEDSVWCGDVVRAVIRGSIWDLGDGLQRGESVVVECEIDRSH